MRVMKKLEFAENAIRVYNHMSKLKEKFLKEERGKILKELGLTNISTCPRLIKIVINSGLGEALTDKKAIESMGKQLELICGQKPMICCARKDISSFKLRKGDVIGLKVTLHGNRMYDFFEKLVKIVLPRLRDFRGVKDGGFDGKGSYTLGFSEQTVFPEIEYNQVDRSQGLEATFVTSGRNSKETKKLLEVLGMPFTRKMERDQGKP